MGFWEQHLLRNATLFISVLFLFLWFIQPRSSCQMNRWRSRLAPRTRFLARERVFISIHPNDRHLTSWLVCRRDGKGAFYWSTKHVSEISQLCGEERVPALDAPLSFGIEERRLLSTDSQQLEIIPWNEIKLWFDVFRARVVPTAVGKGHTGALLNSTNKGDVRMRHASSSTWQMLVHYQTLLTISSVDEYVVDDVELHVPVMRHLSHNTGRVIEGTRTPAALKISFLHVGTYDPMEDEAPDSVGVDSLVRLWPRVNAWSEPGSMWTWNPHRPLPTIYLIVSWFLIVLFCGAFYSGATEIEMKTKSFLSRGTRLNGCSGEEKVTNSERESLDRNTTGNTESRIEETVEPFLGQSIGQSGCSIENTGGKIERAPLFRSRNEPGTRDQRQDAKEALTIHMMDTSTKVIGRSSSKKIARFLKPMCVTRAIQFVVVELALHTLLMSLVGVAGTMCPPKACSRTIIADIVTYLLSTWFASMLISCVRTGHGASDLQEDIVAPIDEENTPCDEMALRTKISLNDAETSLSTKSIRDSREEAGRASLSTLQRFPIPRATAWLPMASRRSLHRLWKATHLARVFTITRARFQLLKSSILQHFPKMKRFVEVATNRMSQWDMNAVGHAFERMVPRWLRHGLLIFTIPRLLAIILFGPRNVSRSFLISFSCKLFLGVLFAASGGHVLSTRWHDRWCIDWPNRPSCLHSPMIRIASLILIIRDPIQWLAFYVVMARGTVQSPFSISCPHAFIRPDEIEQHTTKLFSSSIIKDVYREHFIQWFSWYTLYVIFTVGFVLGITLGPPRWTSVRDATDR